MQYQYFFNLTSPFSNFHPSVFTYKDLTFVSNEQFLMYGKAKTFHDEKIAQEIMEFNKHPLLSQFISGEISREEIINNTQLTKEWNSLMKKIKEKGRNVSNFNDEIWSKTRHKIVFVGAKNKFLQNSVILNDLKESKNNFMVEASAYDKIWGCGLWEQDAKKTPPEQWPGTNLLGKVLNHLKQELFPEFYNNLQISNTENISNSSGISVANFYKLGKQIPENGVYVGRYSKSHNLPESIFANPHYLASEDQRDSVIQRFRVSFIEKIAEGLIQKSDLLELKNKTLVCYCAPKMCHANIIKEIVELLLTNEVEFDKLISQHKSSKKPGLK